MNQVCRDVLTLIIIIRLKYTLFGLQSLPCTSVSMVQCTMVQCFGRTTFRLPDTGRSWTTPFRSLRGNSLVYVYSCKKFGVSYFTHNTTRGVCRTKRLNEMGTVLDLVRKREFLKHLEGFTLQIKTPVNYQNEKYLTVIKGINSSSIRLDIQKYRKLTREKKKGKEERQ